MQIFYLIEMFFNSRNAMAAIYLMTDIFQDRLQNVIFSHKYLILFDKYKMETIVL